MAIYSRGRDLTCLNNGFISARWVPRDIERNVRVNKAELINLERIEVLHVGDFISKYITANSFLNLGHSKSCQTDLLKSLKTIYLKYNEDDFGLDVSLKTHVVLSQVSVDITRSKT